MSMVRMLAVTIGLLFGAGLSAQTTTCRVLDADLQDIHEGVCSGGLAEGHGSAKGLASYQGEFHAGRPHGRGSLLTREGDRYEGEFFEGRPSGRGVFVWSLSGPRSGERYEGQFRAGLAEGAGVMMWANGDRLTGDWRAGRPEAPLSASMLRRLRAHAELAAAVGAPGTKVCRRITMGIASRQWISGRVVGLQFERLKVTLDHSVSSMLTLHGALLSPAMDVEDDFLSWIPCR